MTKRAGILLLDAAILLCASVCAALSCVYLEGISRWAAAGVCGLVIMTLLTAEGISLLTGRSRKGKRKGPEASLLILLNEAEQEIQRWELRGKTALLLGKASGEADPPEIDLGETAFASSIDEQQAVLNYSLSGWLVEDLSSRNGTVLQKPGADARKLVEGVPCLLETGDRLYVAGDTVFAVN